MTMERTYLWIKNQEFVFERVQFERLLEPLSAVKYGVWNSGDRSKMETKYGSLPPTYAFKGGWE